MGQNLKCIHRSVNHATTENYYYYYDYDYASTITNYFVLLLMPIKLFLLPVKALPRQTYFEAQQCVSFVVSAKLPVKTLQRQAWFEVQRQWSL